MNLFSLKKDIFLKKDKQFYIISNDLDYDIFFYKNDSFQMADGVERMNFESNMSYLLFKKDGQLYPIYTSDIFEYFEYVILE